MRAKRFAERLQMESESMHKLSRGLWTCAALYLVIGLIGILFLTTQPSVATSGDGYGIASFAAPASLR